MRYVLACERHDWSLQVWPHGHPEEYVRLTYRCKSWRHEGACRLWRAAQDFARISEAIESRETWTYIVLTFDPKDWDEWKRQYVQAVRLWSMVRLRLRREYGRLQYIQTWERHVKEGIHVNILLGNDEIFSEVTRDRYKWRRKVLEPMVVDCGFGKRTWCEPMRTGTGKGMAAYLTDLAQELTGQGGKGQIPFDAPPHFRRIRASRGLLPKPIKGDYEGKMWFAPRECFEKDGGRCPPEEDVGNKQPLSEPAQAKKGGQRSRRTRAG